MNREEAIELLNDLIILRTGKDYPACKGRGRREGRSACRKRAGHYKRISENRKGARINELQQMGV